MVHEAYGDVVDNFPPVEDIREIAGVVDDDDDSNLRDLFYLNMPMGLQVSSPTSGNAIRVP